VGVVLTVLLLGFGVALVKGLGPFDDAVREIVLPLKHEDVIRQQARAKDLDPALVAAVIYEESRFRDQTSPAGAKGLMQLTPETAQFIAKKSGGSAFELRDLATPQVNIAYGTWYLRYLRGLYNGDETLAVAAYNAGETNVDRWVVAAGGTEAFDPADDIPFKETRDYVADVAEKRRLYRRHYKRELGL
jgi:soluble lytic murein transglycosylase